MSAVLAMPTLVDPVAELQKEFGLLKLGGKVGLVELPKNGQSWGDLGCVQQYKKEDAKVLLERSLQLIASASNSAVVIKNFFASPRTKVFTQIAFDPRQTSSSVINLWRGPTVIGVPGPFLTIELFLREVVAGGDMVVYEYLLNFLAHMLQKPEVKPGVMPVLMGGQGTGKGTFFKLLSAIWSKTSLITNQIDQITGRFNNVLETVYVVWLDEALFVGNHAATDMLKSLITEQQITIEAKHQTPRSIFSCHRLFAATNADHFAHIDRDDRRMLYLPIPNKHQGDIGYWERVNSALASDELAALVAHLEQRDISKFVPSRRPRSRALAEQKLRSLTGIPAWWFDVLETGVFREELGFLSSGTQTTWDASHFMSSRDLISALQRFARDHGTRHKTATESALKQALEKLCPSAIHTRAMHYGNQARGHSLPTLATARREFAEYMKVDIEWGL
jgi:hypothetical protein